MEQDWLEVTENLDDGDHNMLEAIMVKEEEQNVV